MTKGTGGDQAVHSRPDRPPRSAGRSIQIDRLRIPIQAHWRFHDGQRQHGFARANERWLRIEPLKHFLDHGQARGDVVEVEPVLEPNHRRLAKDLDPNRGINENHGAEFCTPLCLPASSTNHPATGPNRPAAESDALWRAAPFRARRVQRCASRFVRRSHVWPLQVNHHQAQDLYVSYTSSVTYLAARTALSTFRGVDSRDAFARGGEAGFEPQRACVFCSCLPHPSLSLQRGATNGVDGCFTR